MMLDKHDDWDVADFGQFKIQNIKNEIESYLEEWLLDTSRQEEYETHEHTFMYALKQLDYAYDLSSSEYVRSLNTIKNEMAMTELSTIIEFLEQAVGGKTIRIEFINMKPNSRVRSHRDRSDLLYVGRRFHIPIKTNELVFFRVGGEDYKLETGRLYELNNIKYHSVYNHSLENRVHLIIDVLPNKYTQNLVFES